MDRESPESYEARSESGAESSSAPSSVLNRANEDIGQKKRIDENTTLKTIELYSQGLSERKVAKILEISCVTVHRILVRNNVSRRSIMKYPKTDFSGSIAEQARISGFANDCWAGHNRKQIRVHTTTTHPAQMQLFNNIFGRYGHVSKTPQYNNLCSIYEWRVWVDLNDSFQFLINYKKDPLRVVAGITESGYIYDHAAGMADAESWVGIDANNGRPRAGVHIANDNKQILQSIQRFVGGGIAHDKDGYQLKLYGEHAVEVLRKLPLAHDEKVAAKWLILHHYDNGGIGMEALREHRELRQRIDDEVMLCTMQARLEWIRRHGKPHRDDPDQTIPRINPPPSLLLV